MVSHDRGQSIPRHPRRYCHSDAEQLCDRRGRSCPPWWECVGRSGYLRIVVNGHAGENFALTREELRRVVEVVRGAVPKSCWLTAGIDAESSLEAARQAADAEKAGANALLVFPPYSWALYHDVGMVAMHHEHIEGQAACRSCSIRRPSVRGGWHISSQLSSD